MVLNLVSRIQKNPSSDIDEFLKFMKDLYIDLKDAGDLYRLLNIKEVQQLSEELIENGRLRLNNEDLKRLLSEIDNDFEICCLCGNTLLIKRILNEFILNKELVDKLNTIVEKIGWCKDENIHTVFDLIEFHATHSWDAEEEEYYERDEDEIDQELLELNELNRIIYSFDLSENQGSRLVEVLNDNEFAQNRLKEIVENHLENDYDFESLLQYLKKKEKRNLINI